MRAVCHLDAGRLAQMAARIVEARTLPADKFGEIEMTTTRLAARTRKPKALCVRQRLQPSHLDVAPPD